MVASCQANADPPPMILWFRGDQMLNDGDQSSGNISISQNIEGMTPSSQLTNTGITSEGEGVYSCVTINSLGNDSRSFQVNTIGESAILIFCQ